MEKLGNAIKDYWAVIVSFGGALVTAYDIIDQLIKFGFVKNNLVWPYGILIFIVFGAVAIIRTLSEKRKYKDKTPNIKFQNAFVDERDVIIIEESIGYSSVTGSYSGGTIDPRSAVPIPENIKKVEKYYFAHVVFTNDPMAGEAKNVFAIVEFYDNNYNRLPINDFYGRWGQHKPQPHNLQYWDQSRDQIRIDILANGEPYELDITMKHKSEAFCFAFNDTNYSNLELRKRQNLLSGNEYLICVTLKGEKFMPPSFWFKLLNEKKNGSMQISKFDLPKKFLLIQK